MDSHNVIWLVKNYAKEGKRKANCGSIKRLKFDIGDSHCTYDDDEDYTITITPVLSTKEPVDSLIMEDAHLDTIPSVENLIQSQILSESNNDGTSSDDDSYENIEYVEASPLNLEYDSLEEVNEDQEEKEFDLEDIFQIQDVILREELLNISRESC
ncbi:hypothetical protein Tco_0399904 [Tanacetum coccineum]